MTTQKDRIKQNELVTRITLKRMLKYTDEDLNQKAFKGAYVYMREIFGTEEHFPLTKEFWTWWRREWASIDDAFLDALRVTLDATWIRDRDNQFQTHAIHGLAELREWYDHYHEASIENRHVCKDVIDAVRKAIIFNFKIKETI